MARALWTVEEVDSNMILTMFSTMMIMLGIHLMSSVYAFSDESKEYSFMVWPTVELGQCAQSNKVTKYAISVVMDFPAIHMTYSSGLLNFMRYVASMHDNKMSRKYPIPSSEF